LLNQMGGFSKQHPTIFDIYPDTEKVFEQWRMLNVPGSLKNGGRIAKYQGAGWIGKGIKWLSTKGDDVVKSVQNTHAIKSFNKGITQSKFVYNLNPKTGSFDFVIKQKPFNYKFKHVKDLSDSEIRVL
jgi:hypothetical protein